LALFGRPGITGRRSGTLRKPAKRRQPYAYDPAKISVLYAIHDPWLRQRLVRLEHAGVYHQDLWRIDALGRDTPERAPSVGAISSSLRTAAVDVTECTKLCTHYRNGGVDAPALIFCVAWP